VRDFYIQIVVTIGVIAGVIGIAMLISAYSCLSRWSDSGMDAKWRPGAGCRVQYDGKWIPEKNYREMP
jgi:hypothetical protein